MADHILRVENSVFNFSFHKFFKENKVLRLKAQQQNDEERQCSAREMEKRIQMKKQNERINEEIKRNKERERELEKLENLKVKNCFIFFRITSNRSV